VQWWDVLHQCKGLTSLCVRSTRDISSSNLADGIASTQCELRHLDLQLDCAYKQPGGSVMRTQYMLQQILPQNPGRCMLNFILIAAVSIMNDQSC
jgi:hypothetical protein